MNTTEKKLTKKQKFQMLLELDAVKNDEMLTEFVEHEIELLDKKNAVKGEKKPTAKQAENASFGDMVVEGMSPNVLYTASQLLKTEGLPEDMSLPRLTHILTALVADKRLVRTVDKRKAYFSLP